MPSLYPTNSLYIISSRTSKFWRCLYGSLKDLYQTNLLARSKSDTKDSDLYHFAILLLGQFWYNSLSNLCLNLAERPKHHDIDADRWYWRLHTLTELKTCLPTRAVCLHCLSLHIRILPDSSLSSLASNWSCNCCVFKNNSCNCAVFVAKVSTKPWIFSNSWPNGGGGNHKFGTGACTWDSVWVLDRLDRFCAYLALLDYVSRAHEIEIRPSSVVRRPSSVRPSVVSIISEVTAWISFKF